MQLIGATDDGKAFDGEDAQLALDRGTPRFYIMRLPARLPALTFDRITFHGQVCASCVVCCACLREYVQQQRG